MGNFNIDPRIKFSEIVLVLDILEARDFEVHRFIKVYSSVRLYTPKTALSNINIG